MEKSKSNEKVHIVHDGANHAQNSVPKAVNTPPPPPQINERSIPQSVDTPPPPKPKG
jgi:hypothetical protein